MADKFTDHPSISELVSLARGADSSNLKTGVLVLGGGVTGAAVAEKFSSAGIKTSIIDQGRVCKRARDLGLPLYEQFDPASGSLPVDAVFAVISPGIGPHYPLPKLVLSAGIPIVTELDIAFSILGMPLVGVTGTNGKTTTATIIDAMLTNSQLCSALVGNVGTPPIDLIDSGKLVSEIQDQSTGVSASPALVAELSSYQLEQARSIRPRVGIWLNLDDNHLERHKTIEGYLAAKARLFEDQDPKSDFSVICREDPNAGAMVKLARGRLCVFGFCSNENEFSLLCSGILPFQAEIGCFVSPGGKSVSLIRLGQQDGSEENGVKLEHYDLRSTKLLGQHNRLNLAGAIAAARLAGASPTGVQQTIDSFEPIEHRIELLTLPERGPAPDESSQTQIIINDSKSTNPLASAVALAAVTEKYPERKIVLLLGGAIKQGSWKPLGEEFERTGMVSHTLIFGPDRMAITRNLSSESPRFAASSSVEQFEKVRPAIERALSLSAGPTRPVLLFSPGCASFDEFTDYTARGRFFKQLVLGQS